MKAIIFFLFFSAATFAQTYTEKYNPDLNRFEYFNSAGQKIGIKTYESITGTWKYTDLTEQYNNAYNKSPADYGTPTSSIDTSLLSRAMGSRQERYDANKQKIQDKINYLVYQIENSGISQARKNRMQTRFTNECINQVNRTGGDLSNENTTIQILNFLSSGYNKIIKEE